VLDGDFRIAVGLRSDERIKLKFEKKKNYEKEFTQLHSDATGGVNSIPESLSL
jgi:hypothetical protein